MIIESASFGHKHLSWLLLFLGVTMNGFQTLAEAKSMPSSLAGQKNLNPQVIHDYAEVAHALPYSAAEVTIAKRMPRSLDVQEPDISDDSEEAAQDQSSAAAEVVERIQKSLDVRDPDVPDDWEEVAQDLPISAAKVTVTERIPRNVPNDSEEMAQDLSRSATEVFERMSRSLDVEDTDEPDDSEEAAQELSIFGAEETKPNNVILEDSNTDRAELDDDFSLESDMKPTAGRKYIDLDDIDEQQEENEHSESNSKSWDPSSIHKEVVLSSKTASKEILELEPPRITRKNTKSNLGETRKEETMETVQRESSNRIDLDDFTEEQEGEQEVDSDTSSVHKEIVLSSKTSPKETTAAAKSSRKKTKTKIVEPKKKVMVETKKKEMVETKKKETAETKKKETMEAVPREKKVVRPTRRSKEVEGKKGKAKKSRVKTTTEEPRVCEYWKKKAIQTSCMWAEKPYRVEAEDVYNAETYCCNSQAISNCLKEKLTEYQCVEDQDMKLFVNAQESGFNDLDCKSVLRSAQCYFTSGTETSDKSLLVFISLSLVTWYAFS